MNLLFNPWELLYLQQMSVRWFSYKGETFSYTEQSMLMSIKNKVQVANGVLVNFTKEENEFLQSLFRRDKDNYGKPANTFDIGARKEVSQRTVYIVSSILAKLTNTKISTINPSDTEALQS